MEAFAKSAMPFAKAKDAIDVKVGMQYYWFGTLTLTITEAILKEDLDWFGDMDPYCKFTFEGVTYETPVVQEGGKHPVWKKDNIFDGLVIDDIDAHFQIYLYDQE